MSNEKQKVDYGVDAPGVIRNLFLAGLALLVLWRFVPAVTVGGATFIFTAMFRKHGDRVYRGRRADGAVFEIHEVSTPRQDAGDGELARG